MLQGFQINIFVLYDKNMLRLFLKKKRVKKTVELSLIFTPL